MEDKILSREEFLMTVLHQWGAATAECRDKLEAHDEYLRAALQEAQQERDSSQARAEELDIANDSLITEATVAQGESARLTADLAKERETSERRHKWNESLAATLDTANKELDAERETSRELRELFTDLLTWMRGLRPTGDCGIGPLFGAGIATLADACTKKADEVEAEAARLIAKGGE